MFYEDYRFADLDGVSLFRIGRDIAGSGAYYVPGPMVCLGVYGGFPCGGLESNRFHVWPFYRISLRFGSQILRHLSSTLSKKDDSGPSSS